MRSQGPSRPPPDAATGVLQRRMSNGIKLNFKQSDNEPRAAMLRIVAAGGRACEGVQLLFNSLQLSMGLRQCTPFLKLSGGKQGAKCLRVCWPGCR